MKQYASSVYSQKSTTSAKSGRSFLSFTWSKKPYQSTVVPIQEDTITNDTMKQSVWQSVKSWATIKTENDSISKFKNWFKYNKKSTQHDSPRQSIDDNTTLEEEEEEQAWNPTGILINCHDNQEAIAERKKKRHQHILKLQKRNSRLTYHPCFKENTEVLASSSDTLLTDEPVKTKKKSVAFFQDNDDDDDDSQYNLFNPRIMFHEPSPVPRFRNVAPPPPPSPPYLDIFVGDDTHSIIQSPEEDGAPTIFTQRAFLDEHDENMIRLYETLTRPLCRPKLYFYSPLQRGQTIKFSLKNRTDDHILLFKFLTTNMTKGQPERYFVRPSAGVLLDSADILLFLNQIPSEPKDKIMVRWAAIQRHTTIEAWVHTLEESTRRKWIDMLEEKYPDQVTIRMTRIKIRFQ